MTLPVLDRSETLASLIDSAARWSNLVRTARDPSAKAVGHWSVRDVAVHTSHLFGLFPELVAGGRSPIEDHLKLGHEWDEMVKQDGEQDMNVLADRIDRATAAFIEAATNDAWTSEVWWHGGLRVPVYSLAGILINEAEMHGLDVAQVEGKPWSIARPKAVSAIVALMPVLPFFVDEHQAKGLDATFELRVRGGPTVYLTVQGGSLFIDATPRRVDCHLSVDPVDYLLIGYGRKSQWLPIAAGKVVAWGKKPWLSLRFAKLFHSQ